MSAMWIGLGLCALGGALALVLLWLGSRDAEDALDVLEWMDPPPAHWNKEETKLWK